jgi:RNA recognition motif-containing protein
MKDLLKIFFVDLDYQIARNPTTGQSNGYGFVAYESFEAADTAIESMNGQFLMNKAITVQYAFKKDGKGERHGTPAERLLAAQARKNNALPSATGANLPAPPPSAPNPMVSIPFHLLDRYPRYLPGRVASSNSVTTQRTPNRPHRVIRAITRYRMAHPAHSPHLVAEDTIHTNHTTREVGKEGDTTTQQ